MLLLFFFSHHFFFTFFVFPRIILFNTFFSYSLCFIFTIFFFFALILSFYSKPIRSFLASSLLFSFSLLISLTFTFSLASFFFILDPLLLCLSFFFFFFYILSPFFFLYPSVFPFSISHLLFSFCIILPCFTSHCHNFSFFGSFLHLSSYFLSVFFILYFISFHSFIICSSPLYILVLYNKT